jgi:hypothetical protein
VNLIADCLFGKPIARATEICCTECSIAPRSQLTAVIVSALSSNPLRKPMES